MQARAHPQSSVLPYHLILIAFVVHIMAASLAQNPPVMSGIYESCPTNVRFWIKNLIKVGFQKNLPVNVKLHLKIRNMLCYPKVPARTSKNQVATPIHPHSPCHSVCPRIVQEMILGCSNRTCHFYPSLPYPILSYYAMVLARLPMLLTSDGLGVRYTNNLP